MKSISLKSIIVFIVLILPVVVSAQRIAVLSDVHVTPGNKADSVLREAVKEINASEYPLVVVNGDLTNEGSDQELLNIKGILDNISHPLKLVPGNHENNWSQSATKTFFDLWGNDRFVTSIGDSLLVVGINCGPFMKMGDGHIKQEDLHWLKKTLDENLKPGMKVLSMNHYPIRKDDLDNYAEYANLLAQYPVAAHINGHYHSWMQYEAAGIPGIMIRSLAMKDGTQGYTILDINSDTVKVYDKVLGKQPQLKFSVAITDDFKPIPADSLPQCPKELPGSVQCLWTDSASIFTRLAIDNERVYFGTSLGQARALDRENGNLAWSVPLGASIFSRPVVLPGGRVAFPYSDGIAIIDSATGNLLCDLPSSEGPYVADGALSPDSSIYVQGGYKRIEARDAHSLDLLWTYDSIDNYCQAAPVIRNNEIIFGAWDTNLRCLDLQTGQLKWQWNNGKSNNMLSPGNVVPVVNAENVIIVAPDRFMTCINREDGAQTWRDNSHRYRESLGSSADNSKVYAKTMDGELVCVDALSPTFSQLWLSDLGLGYEHAPGIILENGNCIFVGSRRGIVTAVDALSGDVIWQLPLGSSEVNGFDIGPDGSIWTSLIEGAIWRVGF